MHYFSELSLNCIKLHLGYLLMA